MPDYKAPLRDMRFVLNEVLDLDGHYASLGLEDVTSELLNAFLEEGAKERAGGRGGRGGGHRGQCSGDDVTGTVV